ncbi:MAG: hypothetical protein EZS28_035273, partial [Streblomastix strix]
MPSHSGGLMASSVHILSTGAIPIQTYILVLAPIFEESHPRIYESSVANFHANINLLGQNVLTALEPLNNVVSQNIFDTTLSYPIVSFASIPQGTGKNHVGYQSLANATNRDLMLANDIIVQINPPPSPILFTGQFDDQVLNLASLVQLMVAVRIVIVLVNTGKLLKIGFNQFKSITPLNTISQRIRQLCAP